MNASSPAIWLIPVDGSDAALNAVRYAIRAARQSGTPPEIDLINVQAPLSTDISRFINAETLAEFHRDSGDQALASARELLEASGLAHRTHVLIGEAAPAIADFAQQHGSTQIIMGARGLGSLASALLGSVTVKVVHLSPVPVLLVK